ncbi:unnamed protein product [marine sediment metagenome]|jgi:hypothetical protein|uniref:Uncharacterized protein n=1 Tax=marine sediment metagenome TaxID=412755 RepID=X0ZV83_9ZZZZ
MAETTIASALCGVMEQALIEKGVDPTLAKALSQRACQPALEAAPSVAKKAARKTRRGAKAANRKLSEAFKEANRRLRKKNGELRSGKTQADVARLAQRLRRKM